MKKLVLQNWKDKKAQELTNKVTEIETNVKKEDEKLTSCISETKNVVAKEVPFSFSPEVYKWWTPLFKKMRCMLLAVS